MARSRSDGILDPLKDAVYLDDLAWVAPWIAEDVRAIGQEEVRGAAALRGVNPDAAHELQVWISIIAYARHVASGERQAA